MEHPSSQATADEPVYVISVAARLVGLPGWVLRVLDQEGVVVPSRTDSNRRLYSNNDIAKLLRVRQLTEERGVNIAGVKVILEMEQDRAQTDPMTDSTLSALPARAPSPSSAAPTASASRRDLTDAALGQPE